MSRPAPRDDLRALTGYHSPQVDVEVRLNTNESPFPPPAAFVARWLAELGSVPLHRYPDRSARLLREALGASFGVPSSRVLCANGSNEVLQSLLLTYGGPGRRALVFEPTYALHAHIARITGTEVVVAERDPDTFAVDPDAARAAIERFRPHVVLLCDPNNPTGTSDGSQVLDALLDASSDAGPALVVVDEAYGEFARASAVERVSDDRPLVVARTYSKVWSMAALRLGYAVGPEAVLAEVESVLLPYHLDAPTQLAGVLALDYQAEMKARISLLVEERERLFGALEDLPGVTPYPSGANYLLFRVHGDGHAVWEGLVERGVLVRDFSRRPRLAECLRVTVGTRAENSRFLDALAEVLAGAPGRGSARGPEPVTAPPAAREGGTR